MDPMLASSSGGKPSLVESVDRRGLWTYNGNAALIAVTVQERRIVCHERR
jgi:hypothetical protein